LINPYEEDQGFSYAAGKSHRFFNVLPRGGKVVKDDAKEARSFQAGSQQSICPQAGGWMPTST